MKNSSKGRPGFTLVELLVVIAIIGVLAALTATGVFMALSNRRSASPTSYSRTAGPR
jgi:prepilin-type N-terminal cleavage/methylation domain-containing protein